MHGSEYSSQRMHDRGLFQGEKRHVKLEGRRRLGSSGRQARVAGSEAMTRLLEALEALGLSGQVDTSGRLMRVRGERCLVYVFEATRGGGYYTWCDPPGEGTVEFYPDLVEAIRAGMRRSSSRAGPVERDGGVIEEARDQPGAWH